MKCLKRKTVTCTTTVYIITLAVMLGGIVFQIWSGRPAGREASAGERGVLARSRGCVQKQQRLKTKINHS